MHNLTITIPILSAELNLGYNQVKATINLLDEGSTIPFISRYRKEATGNLDEVDIERIKNGIEKLRNIETRKASILSTIEEQGKLTEELKKRINDCWDANILEDIYLPYKPKRKTRATVARERGLEPLALWLMNEPNSDVFDEAAKYLTEEVKDEDIALEGARDIIAEIINEHELARAAIRTEFEKNAFIISTVYKSKKDEAVKYSDYFDFAELLKKCPSHRILAVFRGEDEGFLKVKIEPDINLALEKLDKLFIKRNNQASGHVAEAIEDCYERLLAPSMENEFRNLAKQKADDEAIRVFTENLRQLLLSAPLGSKRIMGIDPGFRSGCKIVCLNEEGKLLADDVVYPHQPQMDKSGAMRVIQTLVAKHTVQAISIGNGTAGRETEELVRSISFAHPVEIYVVSESGASVYSASEIAREEFPDKDVTVRGAVSIGRRLSDPLAELVKIDPKSIGVGQYQHDVDQNKLKKSLDVVVESCVNVVGVNLNTASKSLLTYVSGLGPQLAQNIIDYRNENGAFTSRKELKKVPRLGDKAFEQCAGFLRIANAKNVLDNSAVHPESYGIVEAMAKDLGCKVDDLIKDETLRKKISPQQYVTEKAGLPTITDILKELAKPGRDPREMLKPFEFADVKKPEDLTIGMILPGIVTNITNFGCFVDIGVKQDGLVHISQLADKFVSDPNQVVKLQQQVTVKVVEVDMVRKRIALTMKLASA
ncbi:MAG: RNA-binding transcriptional accessory protein [Bacteroidetes bacterium]|nr:MAG: RNA-binding transcriptional accessory protein [Bacteroidota bacterium]